MRSPFLEHVIVQLLLHLLIKLVLHLPVYIICIFLHLPLHLVRNCYFTACIQWLAD